MTWLRTVPEAFERWRTMRQLRSIERREQSDHSWDFDDLMFEAHEALGRDLRGRAVDLWTQASTGFPNLAVTSESALNLLLRLQMYDEAEALMNRGLKRSHNTIYFLEGLAQVAYKRGDREATLRFCTALQKRYPDSLKGYALAAAALSELGRSEHAEEMLGRGLVARPQEITLRIEHARLAERRKDWEEAIRRWTIVHETYHHLAGTAGIASSLARLGRYDEADAVIAGVAHRAGNDVGIRVTSAEIMEHKQDWDEAILRWDVVRVRFPMSAVGYLRASRLLETLGRKTEADAILQDSTARMADNEALFIESAWFAHRNRDWAEAARRWATVRQRFPRCGQAYERGSQALAELGLTAEAEQIRAAAAARFAQPANISGPPS
jgi:tetratricopeptide (TPR) repeat protein